MMTNFFIVLLLSVLAMLNSGVSATYPEEYKDYYYPQYDYPYEYKEPSPYEYYPYQPYDYYPYPMPYKEDKKIDATEIARNVYPRIGSKAYEKMQKYMDADGTTTANKYCLRIIGYPCYKL